MWSAALIVYMFFSIVFVATTVASIVLASESVVSNMIALFFVIVPIIVINGFAVQCMALGDYCRTSGWVLVGFMVCLSIAASVILYFTVKKRKADPKKA
jgi:hypothetical protein